MSFETSNQIANQATNHVNDAMIHIPYVATRSFGDYYQQCDFKPYTERTFDSARVTPSRENEQMRNHFNELAASFMMDESENFEWPYQSFDSFINDKYLGNYEKPRYSIKCWKDDKWHEYDFDEYEVMNFYKQKWTAETGCAFPSDDEDEAPVLK